MGNRPEYLAGLKPVSAAEWKMALQAGLKGGDYASLLTSEIAEGIRIKPFYNWEDLEKIRPGQNLRNSSWKIATQIESDGTNTAFQHESDWEQGVDAWIIPLMDGQFEWPEWITTRNQWPAEVHIQLQNPNGFNFENRPESLTKKTKILLDPIGNFAGTGIWIENEPQDLNLEPAASKIEAHEMDPALLISGEIFQQAGGNAVQEIAYSLALAHEYLLLQEQNPNGWQWFKSPVFRLALGGEYFTDIAKIRALRNAWGQLARLYKLQESCIIQVQPSLRNKACYDYNTNLLRSTLECMAGIFGGADLICNIPYDKIFSPPNAFADRLAMNQLLIMRHEAGLAQVQNPADGSFYIESLSDQLGKKAMDLFKTIEAGGGFLEQLKKHTIQKKIKQNAQREQEAFDKGTKILVGSNRFSNSTEKLIHAEIRKTQKNKGKRTQIEPLILRRLSREYEHNRGKNESR